MSRFKEFTDAELNMLGAALSRASELIESNSDSNYLKRTPMSDRYWKSSVSRCEALLGEVVEEIEGRPKRFRKAEGGK